MSIEFLSSKSKSIIISFVALIIVASGIYFYSTRYFFKDDSTIEGPFKLPNSAKAQQELSDTLNIIGESIVLPSNDTPTMATVFDKDKLKDEPFFDPAENGDKVILFPISQLAILYRPSSKKIVFMSKVSNLQDNNSQPSTDIKEQTQEQNANATQTTPKPITASISIYNGSSKAGLATTTKAKLSEQFPKAVIKVGGDAKGNYDKTLIIASNAKFSQEATLIAQAIGASVDKAPRDESLKGADIYIIVAE